MQKSLATSLIGLWICFCPVAFAQKPAANEPSALEKKLQGEWISDQPCGGDIMFNADGSYERRRYSPGSYKVTGSWSIRWDALPPTMTLTVKTSGDEKMVGKSQELKLIQLDDATISYRYQSYPDSLNVYSRVKK